MSNCIKKPNDLSNLDPKVKQSMDAATKEEKLSLEGIGCDKKLEPIPNFRKAPCEDVVANGQNNVQIVAGRDRPSTLLSGYGGRGDTQAGSIDIVVGRMSANPAVVTKENKKIFVDPDFEKDAARIHISQKTDVDKNFNIADGVVGNSITRSGIGIKADSVRIVGREGVKIVTQTDNKNSLGGDILSTKGIDLIAGNDDSDLQPLVKGNNLLEILRIIVEDIRRINGMVNSLATKQVALDAALVAHTHLVMPLPPAALIAIPSVELGIAATADAAQIAALDFPSHASHTANSITSEIDYLKPGGSKYIISKFNNTN
tara:strand:- start:1788 stop:2735 length:948 start_codon:yes stop_codon:yes gene_type:complete